jgi:hypothetical protein
MKKSLILACLGAALLLGCGGLLGDNNGNSDDGGLLGNILGNFTSGLLGGSNLQLRSGLMPEADVGAEDFIEGVEMNGYVISGGSLMFTVTSRLDLDSLYIKIEGEDGYYALKADSCFKGQENSLYVYNPSIEVTQELAEANDSLKITVNGKSKTGKISANPETKTVETKEVGAGKLQISLAWDNNDDLDLYVLTPSGEEIYFNHGNENKGHSPVDGGLLDLDANAACNGDLSVRNENIFFEAPLVDGNYAISVKLWGKCSTQTGAAFTVRAVHNGQSIVSEKGSFLASENSGNKAIKTIKVSSSGTKVEVQ